jgi:hypothetical protein
LAGVPGAHRLTGSVDSVHVVPPVVVTPTPMPWAPPFDQRSWCHMVTQFAGLAGLTPMNGSTSASRNTRPDWIASREVHALSGDGPDTLTTIASATAVDDVITATALASAEIHKAFFSNSQSPQ